MARLRYIADNPRGPRGGNHDARTLYASADSAARSVLTVKGELVGRVLLVDLDELLRLERVNPGHSPAHFHSGPGELFEWHESRWLHHGGEMMRLRTQLADSQLKEASFLDTHDLARLREAVSEWDLEEDRLRRGGGATPAARGAFFVMRDLYRAGKLGGRR